MTYDTAVLNVRRLLNHVPADQLCRVGYLVTEAEFVEIAKGLVEYHKSRDEPIVIDASLGWPTDVAAVSILGVPVVPW